MTAQPFRFEGAMPEGFVYDTEPASRGVVAVSLINREAIFSFFKMVQSAFYVGQQDVTNSIVLSQLAAGWNRCPAVRADVRIRYREAPDA